MPVPRHNSPIPTADTGEMLFNNCSSVRYINQYLTNGFSYHYQLDEPTFILGVLGVIFIFFFSLHS